MLILNAVVQVNVSSMWEVFFTNSCQNCVAIFKFLLYKTDLRSRFKVSGTSYSPFPPPEHM